MSASSVGSSVISAAEIASSSSAIFVVEHLLADRRDDVLGRLQVPINLGQHPAAVEDISCFTPVAALLAAFLPPLDGVPVRRHF